MPTLRNPSATLLDLNQRIMSLQSYIDNDIERAENNPDDPHQYQLLGVFKDTMEVFRLRHARGDDIDELASYFMLTLIPAMRHAQKLTKQFFPDYLLRLHASEQWGIPFSLAVVCFDREGTELRQLDDWIDFDGVTPDLDILLQAFVPERPMAKRYGLNKHFDKYRIPVLRVIVEEPEKRQAALRTLMAGWPKLMSKRGYRDLHDGSRGDFDEVPFDAAFAACAYDIDDTACRGLPYYPHDMVAYYRAHVRHTRDAWRAEGAGPACELPMIPQLLPPKVYALKPPQAYVRWVELVCGSNAELLAAARKALGKRKTMPEFETLMEALSDAGAATRADMKDDETLAHQALALATRHGLAGLSLPADPPQGAARCSAILAHLHAWLPEHGAQLFVLGEGDPWQAVFIKATDAPQFIELCEQLSLDVVPESDWR